MNEYELLYRALWTLIFLLLLVAPAMLVLTMYPLTVVLIFPVAVMSLLICTAE